MKKLYATTFLVKLLAERGNRFPLWRLRTASYVSPVRRGRARWDPGPTFRLADSS